MKHPKNCAQRLDPGRGEKGFAHVPWGEGLVHHTGSGGFWTLPGHGVTLRTGWLSTSQQLSLGSEEGRSPSLSSCPGTNRPLPLPCHFPFQFQVETWSGLWMQKFLLCKIDLLEGSKKGALSFL